MALLSTGPRDAREDEEKIGKGYMQWLTPFLLLWPVVGAQYLDFKTVALWSLGIALVMLHEIGGRLHDLCIRLRRTNMLLNAQLSSH